LIGLGIGNSICLLIYFLQEKTGFISLDQDTYYLSKVPFAFDLQMVLIINAGSFFICFLALLIPVQIVSKISPAQTVRFN
jgi:lipoprotein-releasing system permease protein